MFFEGLSDFSQSAFPVAIVGIEDGNDVTRRAIDALIHSVVMAVVFL